MREAKEEIKVSPNNPCPILRALVQQGLLRDDVASIGEVTSTVMRVANAGEGNPSLSSIAIRAIVLIANGLSPGAVLQTGLHGLRLDAIRNGPLDKKGVGSRVLDSQAVVNEAELERLKSFAIDKQAADGTVELGLDDIDLTRMMDENFARAEGNRRWIDRKLMDGEWPVLLQVMGKEGKDGRYLSFAEVRSLFVDRTLPERMLKKLAAP
jgi:hypothetical protein